MALNALLTRNDPAVGNHIGAFAIGLKVGRLAGVERREDAAGEAAAQRAVPTDEAIAFG